ncbi:hypothetical protein BC826DRAFT_508329 [Russula brevipes]|nr:hypothetical protein BC826DRAFT_508329 [Russula brevipes]
MLFRPARDLFLQPIEWWFEMRYVQVAQATGSWPDTWTPILNALRSYQFVADFIDSVNGNGQSPPPPMPHGRCDVNIQPSGMGSATGGHSAPPLQTRRAVQKAPSSPRNVHYERQRKPRRGHTQRHGSVIHGEVEDSSKTVFPRKTFISPPRISPSSPWVNSNSGYGTSSPISKNLSRIAGILFHYPPPRKPVLRPKFNIKTGALSTGGVSNVSPTRPHAIRYPHL